LAKLLPRAPVPHTATEPPFFWKPCGCVLGHGSVTAPSPGYVLSSWRALCGLLHHLDRLLRRGLEGQVLAVSLNLIKPPSPTITFRAYLRQSGSSPGDSSYLKPSALSQFGHLRLPASLPSPHYTANPGTSLAGAVRPQQPFTQLRRLSGTLGAQRPQPGDFQFPPTGRSPYLAEGCRGRPAPAQLSRIGAPMRLSTTGQKCRFDHIGHPHPEPGFSQGLSTPGISLSPRQPPDGSPFSDTPSSSPATPASSRWPLV